MTDKVATCPLCCSKLNELRETTKSHLNYIGNIYSYSAWCDYCGWEDHFSTSDYEIKQSIEFAEKWIALRECKGKTISFMRYKPLEVK